MESEGTTVQLYLDAFARDFAPRHPIISRQYLSSCLRHYDDRRQAEVPVDIECDADLAVMTILEIGALELDAERKPDALLERAYYSRALPPRIGVLLLVYFSFHGLHYYQNKLRKSLLLGIREVLNLDSVVAAWTLIHQAMSDTKASGSYADCYREIPLFLQDREDVEALMKLISSIEAPPKAEFFEQYGEMAWDAFRQRTAFALRCVRAKPVPDYYIGSGEDSSVHIQLMTYVAESEMYQHTLKEIDENVEQSIAALLHYLQECQNLPPTDRRRVSQWEIRLMHLLPQWHRLSFVDGKSHDLLKTNAWSFYAVTPLNSCTYGLAAIANAVTEEEPDTADVA